MILLVASHTFYTLSTSSTTSSTGAALGLLKKIQLSWQLELTRASKGFSKLSFLAANYKWFNHKDSLTRSYSFVFIP